MSRRINPLDYVRQRLEVDPMSNTTLDLAHAGICNGDEPTPGNGNRAMALLESKLHTHYLLRALDLRCAAAHQSRNTHLCVD